MPGHKRNARFNITGAQEDITEISGFDDLHNPHGVILEEEKRLAALYGSEKSFISVNGSTAGILAGVFALTNEGDKVIIARNCHKSVYNACLLRKLKVIFAEPQFDCVNGIYTRLAQEEINSLLAENSGVKAVVITSPTYEGFTSEIKCPVPLLVDAAHGAHLPFGGFPAYPKGDIVVSSLHKTLPALTQTAAVNVFNKAYIDKIRYYLEIFETSSPSYVLMNSVSLCLSYLESSKKDFESYTAALDEFYKSTKLHRLKFIKVDDPGKIVVSTAGTNIDGVMLADILRETYSMEAESAGLRHIILMTSVGDDFRQYKRLSDALEETDGKIKSADAFAFAPPQAKPGIHTFDSAGETTPCILQECEGKICAEFIYAYPPGIPIITPNEIITAETLDMLGALQEHKINTASTSKLLPRFILTKRG